MTDPRTDAVIAAVCARFSGARVVVQERADPGSVPVPDFLIVLDAPRSRLHEAEDFAIERILAAFPGLPMPYAVGAADPATAEEYLRGPQDVEALAAASRDEVRGA